MEEPVTERYLQRYVIISDLSTYRSLLDDDLLDPSFCDFETPSDYSHWKTTESQDVTKLIDAAEAPYPVPKGTLVSITVKDARRLMAKEKGGGSNPYCAISVNGRTFVSDISMNNLNPQWNLEVAIRATESIWTNGYSPFQTLPPQPRRYYAALLRRLLDYDSRQKDGGGQLSATSQAILNNVAMIWRVDDVSRSIALYSTLGMLYVQGVIPIGVLFNEGFQDVYEKMRAPQMVRKSDLQEFIRTSESTLTIIKHHLGTFFNQPVSPQSGKQLEYMVQILGSLYSMPYFSGEYGTVADAMRVSLTNSIEARYHGLYAIAHAIRDDPLSVKLANLVQAVDRELRLYYAHLDTVLLGDIHIPTISAHMYLDKIAVYLDSFASTYAASAPDLADALELYRVVREFAGTVSDIDRSLTLRLAIEQWFRPFVLEWLKISEEKTREWVVNAIKLDKFEPTSANALYSSSVLDIFTSFQQQLDVLAQLQWPEPVESRMFVDTLLENMANALERYCTILSRSAVEDPDLKRRQTQKGGGAVNASPNGKRKLTFSVKKLRKSKDVPVNPDELRFSPEACVRLNNIDEMKNRMAQLRPPNPPPPAYSTDGHQPSTSVPKRKTRLLRITISEAHNLNISRPYTTRLFCKITAPAISGGRELARTKPLRQRPTIRWGETFCCVVTEREFEDGLSLHLVQSVPGKGEYVVGYCSMGRGRLGEVEVRIGGSSGILVDVVEEVDGGSFEFLNERLRWVAEVHERVIVDYLADKLCHDLRDRLKTLSNKHRTAPMKSFMNKVRTSESNITNLLRSPSPTPSPSSAYSSSSFSSQTPHLSLLTDAEVEDDLAPLLQHVNVNLEVLTGTMEHRNALRVVKGLWERILVVLEGLLVPDLGEEDREVKAKEERRVAWCRWAMEILAAFFNGEGEGLPYPALTTERFSQLRPLTEAYFTPRKELEVRFVKAKNGVGGGGEERGGGEEDGDQPEENDWMLKLIKLRGGKEFVEQQMRGRFYGKSW
ncbi:hypothetical protein HK097_009297 [Rhizophlyctis rosea]|uniref:C2 domain-containing protein n=1 Tax=Rhizophlyctis rosea TaxID=64517 RepID=A0AAD5SHC3_9FUNG|nr:hypothetical protein HK097_009297 [Rhizophlyctis rosea]